MRTKTLNSRTPPLIRVGKKMIHTRIRVCSTFLVPYCYWSVYNRIRSVRLLKEPFYVDLKKRHKEQMKAKLGTAAAACQFPNRYLLPEAERACAISFFMNRTQQKEPPSTSVSNFRARVSFSAFALSRCWNGMISFLLSFAFRSCSWFHFRCMISLLGTIPASRVHDEKGRTIYVPQT